MARRFNRKRKTKHCVKPSYRDFEIRYWDSKEVFELRETFVKKNSTYEEFSNTYSVGKLNKYIQIKSNVVKVSNYNIKLDLKSKIERETTTLFRKKLANLYNKKYENGWCRFKELKIKFEKELKQMVKKDVEK
ncbi:MAG: hypothetical protein ACRCYT_06040 [Cetobacterium sp.]